MSEEARWEVKADAAAVPLGGGTANVALTLPTGLVRAYLQFIRVIATASVNFDVQIFEDDAQTANNLLYQNVINNLRMLDNIIGGLYWRNIDGTSVVRMLITNNDPANNSDFNITLRYKPADLFPAVVEDVNGVATIVYPTGDTAGQDTSQTPRTGQGVGISSPMR